MQALWTELLQYRTDGEGQGTQEAGDAIALGDELAVCVGQTRCKVQHFVDDGALGGALESNEHLVPDSHERVFHDLDGEEVHLWIPTINRGATLLHQDALARKCSSHSAPGRRSRPAVFP